MQNTAECPTRVKHEQGVVSHHHSSLISSALQIYSIVPTVDDNNITESQHQKTGGPLLL